MKKIGYSSGMKAIALLLQELFAVVLVLSIILLSTLFSRSMLSTSDLRNHIFTESGYYEMIFQNAVDEVLTFVEYKMQFETNGKYNPEKIVNVMAYMSNNESPAALRELENGAQFRYYLVDLENWSKDKKMIPLHVESQLYVTEEGLMHQVQKVYLNKAVIRESDTAVESLVDMDLALQEQIVEQTSYYYGGSYDVSSYQQSASDSARTIVFADAMPEAVADATDIFEPEKDAAFSGGMEDSDEARAELLAESIQKIINGELYELEGQALVVVLEELGLFHVSAYTDRYVLDEKYMTVEESTVLGEYLNGAITLKELERIYDSLEYTLSTIGNEITTYKRLVNKYEKNGSNLQYWVYEETQDITYTNMPESGTGVDFADIGSTLGSYFYYSKDDIRMSTNVAGMEDAFYQYMEDRNNGYNSVIFVGMNTDFPYADNYQEAMKEYNSLRPWVSVSLVAAVVSELGILITFVYLSLAAGRSARDEDIHLIWFDRIWTEIMLAGLLVMGTGSVGVLNYLRHIDQDISDLFSIMIAAGVIAIGQVAVFMIFYMSLVRRVKAHVMWSGSLLYWVGRSIRKMVKNWRPTLKILAAFIFHVLFTLFLAVTALSQAYDRNTVLIILSVYLLLCAVEGVTALREGVQRNVMIQGIRRIAGGELEYQIDTEMLRGDNKIMGDALNTIGEGLHRAVDDSMKNERLKADLITNVSHDIKTPLTSIINYVDLLKREELENERAQSYIEVLDSKSQRLKQLTEDLVEASKISSGNIRLQIERLNLVELVYQTAGEFDEKFEAKGLVAVTNLPREPVVILADGRRFWRVLENLYGNVSKYAMANTRVYVDMEVLETVVSFSIKNISEQPLNIDASELTERFIRGDVSRGTEGSGLGLSIAKNLTALMGGSFDIYLDGDLFKVTVTFPVAKEEDV